MLKWQAGSASGRTAGEKGRRDGDMPPDTCLTTRLNEDNRRSPQKNHHTVLRDTVPRRPKPRSGDKDSLVLLLQVSAEKTCVRPPGTDAQDAVCAARAAFL